MTVDTNNLAQEIFDKMSVKYPDLEQEHLAAVITFTMKATYDKGRVYFSQKLVEYLNDMWTVISLQKTPKSVIKAVKANPDETMRMAVATVAQRTVEIISQISTVSMAEIDPDDRGDEEIGNPKGVC